MTTRAVAFNAILFLLVAGCGAATAPEATNGVSETVAATEEPSTCEEILARAKEAAGGDAWDEVSSIYSEGTLETGGMGGKFSSLEDVKKGRFHTAYELGPVSGEEGFDGTAVWSKDQNGSVNVSGSQDAVESAANQTFRVARAFWYPERRRAGVRCKDSQREGSRTFRVVEFQPEGGRAYEMWIDEKTWLIDREIESGADQTVTTFLTDYREVKGVMLPYSTRSSTGDAKYDMFSRTDRIQINPEADEAVFQVPEENMSDFSIAGGKDTVKIPFELINNHIFIEASVNGKGPLKMLVDTGGANILTPPSAEKLGVESEGAMEGRGAGENTVDVGLAKVKTLKLGDVELTDQIFYVFPMETLEQVEGIQFDGLVGYEVFKRFTVTIDYADRKLVLRLPEAFEPGAEAVPVPFVFDSHIPQVKGEIDGVAGTFHIDTGNRASLILHGPFAEANKLAEKYKPKVEALTGWGVGGGTRGRVFRAGELKLGDVHIDGPLANLFVGDKGADANKYVSGNVGGGVLKRFTVTFDYKKKLMYLEKNRDYAKQGNWDRSGMWMNLEGDAFVVKDVVEDGPADAAGVKVGDKILAIDGKKVKKLSLSETREKLRNLKPGTKVRLKIENETGAHKITIELREMI